MNEIIAIEGEVIGCTPIFKPDKEKRNLTIVYATVECPLGKDDDGNELFAYYNFRCSSIIQSKNLFKGAQIKCTIRRKSKIWTKNNIWQMKDATEFVDGGRVTVGRLPIILENYDLVGEVDCTPPVKPPLYMSDELDGGSEEDGLPF